MQGRPLLDLQRSVRLARKALKVVPRNSVLSFELISLLAVSTYDIFEFDTDSHLGNTIGALTAESPEPPEYWIARGNILIWKRPGGCLDDIHSAIEAFESALAAARPDSPKTQVAVAGLAYSPTCVRSGRPSHYPF